MNQCIAAALQMTSGNNKSENLATATRLAEEAAERGANLAALPELFNCLGDPEKIVAEAEPIPGPTSQAMSELAARLKITLVAGSIAERASSGEVFNSSLVFAPDGRQLACYRKIHLFDIDIPGGVSFQESKFISPGNHLRVTETPIGRVGQATCYDLRFPELFRSLVDRQADLFVVPAAFTLATGRDHWATLVRARAIENQSFVIAPNQFGRHTTTMNSLGRSLIVDPWGTVLATAPDGEGVITAAIQRAHQSEIRAALPALRHRRDLSEM